MVFLSLNHQLFKAIHLEVDIKENTQLELESSFSFNVNYNEDNSLCVACLHQELKCKNSPQLFSAIVECVGHFTCEGIESEEDKKQAHIQAYALLFPYVQSKIASLTKDAGGPPIMVDMAKMRVEDVKIGN